MELAYLVEPIHVTTTGTIQGKTIRAYEVNVTKDHKQRWVIIPTKRVFTIKDGKVISKKPLLL